MDKKKKKKFPIGLNQIFFMVKDFHRLMKQPIATKISPMPLERAQVRQKWKAEEIAEFIFASARGDKQKAKEAIDFVVSGMYKQLNKCEEKMKKGQLILRTDEDVVVAQMDALGDEMYLGNGDCVEIGSTPHRIVKIIHQANMEKKWADGDVHYDSDGKIIKPENWERDFAPEGKIRADIQRQYKLIGK